MNDTNATRTNRNGRSTTTNGTNVPALAGRDGKGGKPAPRGIARKVGRRLHVIGIPVPDEPGIE